MDRIVIERRQFSAGLKGKNLRYLTENPGLDRPTVRVGFILLEHFSLPAFTQALDALITANLLRPGLFATQTFGLAQGEVVSDLGLVIRPDSQLDVAQLNALDVLWCAAATALN